MRGLREVAVEAAPHLSRKWVTVHGLTFERDADEAAAITCFLQPTCLRAWHLSCAPRPRSTPSRRTRTSSSTSADQPADHRRHRRQPRGKVRVPGGPHPGRPGPEGATSYRIQAFRASHPALTDPSFRLASATDRETRREPFTSMQPAANFTEKSKSISENLTMTGLDDAH